MIRKIPVAVLALGAAFLFTSAEWTHAQRGAVASIPNLAGRILTVKGPIEPSAAGPTLMHEHIFIDFKAPATAGGAGVQQQGQGRQGRGAPGWNLLNNFDESLSEVMEFKKVGGGTIVDTTNFGLSRDPRALVRISEASGLNVVMGAGWYQKALHPPDMNERTVEELTDIVVRDVTVGAQGTNVRSGIIGEVGVQGNPLTDNEIKSIRASARAARITGAPMTLHSFGSGDEMLRTLDIIASEGVDLSRVVMGHMGSRDAAYLKQVFARGVYIEFDYIGQAPLSSESLERLAGNIANLINAGLTERILVAHDICTKPQLKKNGGGGYAYISTVVVPALKAQGVDDESVRKILVDNPRRVLTFVAPQPPVPASASSDAR